MEAVALDAVAQAQLAVEVGADGAHLVLAPRLHQRQRVLRAALHLHRAHQLPRLAVQRERDLGGDHAVQRVARAQLRQGGKGWSSGDDW